MAEASATVSSTHTNLPVLLAGGIAGGRHLRFREDTPLSSLHLTLLGKLGVPMASLGDSNGRLAQLAKL